MELITGGLTASNVLVNDITREDALACLIIWFVVYLSLLFCNRGVAHDLFCICFSFNLFIVGEIYIYNWGLHFLVFCAFIGSFRTPVLGSVLVVVLKLLYHGTTDLSNLGGFVCMKGLCCFKLTFFESEDFRMQFTALGSNLEVTH